MTASAAILPNEKELFVRMAEGDQAAFTKIFDHYEPRIYPFVLKITRSELSAEEIVQELFIKQALKYLNWFLLNNYLEICHHFKLV